jgi:hypothetical protein
MSSLRDKLIETELLDLQFAIKNARISENARRTRENVVKKVLRPYDDEMIKEYRREQNRPFEYIDPNTGETKYKKYQLPNISREDLELEEVPEEISVHQINKEINDIEKQNERLHEYLKELDKRFEKIQKDKKNKQDYFNYFNIENEEDEFIYSLDMKKINNELEKNRKEYDMTLMEINQNLKDIDMIRENYEEYIEKSKQIKKSNIEKIEMFKDKLNTLNTGAFNTEKFSNETESDYMQRLLDTSQLDYPEQELEDAKTMIEKKFNEKMKELIKNPVLISSVINSIDKFDDVKNRRELLKQWEIVKTNFIKIFGLNNNKISKDDIIEFFNNFLISERPEKNIEKYLKDITENVPTVKNMKITVLKNDDILKITNNSTQKDLYLCSTEDKEKNDKFHLLYSFSGERGSFKEYFDGKNETIPPNRKKANKKISSVEEIQDETGLTPHMIKLVFNIPSRINTPGLEPNEITSKLYQIYKIKPLKYTDIRITEKNVVIPQSGRKFIEYGRGNEEIPHKVQFGDVYILLRKLFYDNILAVRNKHNFQIQGFKNCKVSEKFVNIIMNMLRNIEPTNSELMSLNSIEKQIFDRLIAVANLHKSVINHKENTIDALKKRMKLIESEIEIGNNNPELIEELTNILSSLKDFKIITLKQLRDYLKQFNH